MPGIKKLPVDWIQSALRRACRRVTKSTYGDYSTLRIRRSHNVSKPLPDIELFILFIIVWSPEKKINERGSLRITYLPVLGRLEVAIRSPMKFAVVSDGTAQRSGGTRTASKHQRVDRLVVKRIRYLHFITIRRIGVIQIPIPKGSQNVNLNRCRMWDILWE